MFNIIKCLTKGQIKKTFFLLLQLHTLQKKPKIVKKDNKIVLRFHLNLLDIQLKKKTKKRIEKTNVLILIKRPRADGRHTTLYNKIYFIGPLPNQFRRGVI